MNGDEVAAMNAGCDAYLTKPIDRGRFFGTLKSLI
jgi:DNA-binding response OmpR family regulator